MLIVRELSLGDQRFSDLQRHLPGIAATVLTERLRAMTVDNLVETVALPLPARRSAYRLTDRGRDAVPVMAALARFGAPLLERPTRATTLRPALLVRGAIAAFHDPIAALGTNEHYKFCIDGETVWLASANGRSAQTGPPRRKPDLVLESHSEIWIAIRQGHTTLASAITNRDITVTGTRQALTNFRRIFQLNNSTRR